MTRPRDAALVVCHHARDVDDARHLLGALGLLDERNRLTWPKGPPTGPDVRSIMADYLDATSGGAA
jgi:hypothetical protein